MRRTMPIVMLLAAGCVTRPDAAESPGRPTPTGARHRTDRALDLAITGDGFFIVKTPAGGYLFTRHGEFLVSATGQLVNADGYALQPRIFVPGGPGVVGVAADGTVRHTPDGGPPTSIGGILLARVGRPAAMDRDGEYNLPTDASGDPVHGTPGRDGLGTLVSGELED